MTDNCSWASLRSEEHTSELQSRLHLVCRLLLEKKKNHTVPLDSEARCTTLRDSCMCTRGRVLLAVPLRCASSHHMLSVFALFFFFFFFNDPAPPEISPLSLPDALPIFLLDVHAGPLPGRIPRSRRPAAERAAEDRDRKSTRLNSSHGYISYAVFCL